MASLQSATNATSANTTTTPITPTKTEVLYSVVGSCVLQRRNNSGTPWVDLARIPSGDWMPGGIIRNPVNNTTQYRAILSPGSQIDFEE